MKREIGIILACMVMGVAKGQVAQWLIPPSYDAIQMVVGTDLYITDSLEYKVLWNDAGKRLAGTSDHLLPFVNGYAVTTKKGSGTITGFFNLEGKYTDLSKDHVTYSHPYFSDGFLLIQEGSYFRFVNTEGEMGDRLAQAYPFINGYATCRAYKNTEKQKAPYHLLLTKDLTPVPFSWGGKMLDGDDIDFISSINDEGIGVVVHKHKIYSFQTATQTLTPVFARKLEQNIKNQAKIETDLSMCLLNESDSVVVLNARGGTGEALQIRFDSLLVPLSVRSVDGEHIYHRNTAHVSTFTTPLKITEKDQKFGILWDTQVVLPPQLDEIYSLFDDKAIVRSGQQYGMLRILKEESFKISINKSNPIDFRHQKYETSIRLDIPNQISAYNTRIEVNPLSGCKVDMPSAEKRNTEYGNYIQYDCILNIPDSLPDEMYGDARNEITYPVQILYEGLISPIIPVKVKAWHYKYVNVDVNEGETSISQGTLSFTFNINAERAPGEAVYPTIINIQTDSLQWELEKISETRYKCKVLSLREGTNNINVQVQEQGCPPSSFPFEVTYTKPSAKTRNKTKEDVVIKKKNKKMQAPPTPSAPHLDI